jgi:uncharacterized Zn finger protein
VRTLDVRPGEVLAQVKGRRRQLYSVRVALQPLTAEAWGRVIEGMAQQALFAAQILVGDLPPESEEVFERAGVSLFPRGQAIDVDCSCFRRDRACEYGGAVLYALAEAFARDPFLLFALRGCPRERFVARLKARREAQVPPPAETREAPGATPPVEPVAGSPERFWALGAGLGDFEVAIHPPSVETALLKRLGPPPFVRRPAAFKGTLSLVYAAVTRRAQELAFGESERSPAS